MCKYCNNYFNIDKVDMDVEGFIDEKLNFNEVPLFGVSALIDTNKEREGLLTFELEYAHTGRLYFTKKVKIQYCPFCGEKLIKD